MSNINRILAVIDPTVDEQKALDRAVELSSRTGASITALMTIYDFSYEMTTMLSAEERDLMRSTVIQDRQFWLNDLIDSQANLVSQLHGKVVWHNRPYESIINAVIEDNYDIVIKATHEHHTLKSVIFTPTDWHLLRKCPVPVLLVKEHAWPENSKVLAAINASSDEKEHKSLNQKIITSAQNIANLLNSQTLLINSYPGTPVSLTVEIPEFDPSSYIESIKQHHTDSVMTYAEHYKIAPDNCIIKEGLAEDVVPHMATKLDVELVVLGTVGRTGLSAALIGNTAEHMLDAINCDVLALKPDGFISPLQKD